MDGKRNGCSAIVHANLVVDACKVLGYGVFARTEDACNLSVTMARSHKPEHFNFALAEASGQFGFGARPRLRRQAAQPVD